MVMALEKTWCCPTTNALNQRTWYDNEWRSLIFYFKEALVTASVGAWTVVASSDRNVAVMGDTWIDYVSSSRWSGALENTFISPGSWCLLQSPVSARGPYYLLIEITSTNSGAIPIRFWMTRHQPDLTYLVPYRLPPMTGPHILHSSVFQSTGSGYPNSLSFLDVFVAHDGSFFIFNRNVVGNQSNTQSNVNVWGMFNIMQEVPPQDPFGAMFMMFKDSYQPDELTPYGHYEGFGLDGDGVASSRSLVRWYPIQVNSYYAAQNPLKATIEDPHWNKLVSLPLYVYCKDAGRVGLRGRLSDVWWSPSQYQTGTVGWIDSTTKVQNLSALWVPCPTEPFAL